MTGKKQKVMSIAMEPEVQAILKNFADEEKISVSAVMRDLVQKYLVTDGQSTKIILSLPNEILANGDKLEEWLKQKTTAIMAHFKSGSR